MSYSNTPSRSIVGEDYLQQRMSNITLQNDYEQGMYSVAPSDPYADPMGSQWEYQAPETRNMDTIVTELTPEEVRWFYKTEGEKRWLEFSGYDSYRIEMRYREMFYNKQDYGSKYSSYSAFSDMSSGIGSAFGASSIRFPNKSANMQGNYRYQDASQHKIVVRGGLYDVNFDTMQCASIYWPGEECMITRGTWFYEGSWQPLDRDQSQVLETKHLQMFQGRKMSEYGDCEAKGTPLHTENFPDFIVEWFSPGQVYLYSENKPSKIVRSVTSRLGFHKSTGYRLFRGYKTDASLDDRPDVEITHLVFVIHGIGQKMDTGRIIRNTSSLRDCVSWLKQKYFVNYPHHRAEFFPVEWRSNLQLDGELVDAITPNTLQSLRQMLNASAMDIMYYTSPLYGGEVQRGLREELNRLYSMFSARNPYFTNKGGKISVIAHSLGCVILYDIIMGLKPGSLVHNAQQGLLFQIQNFFCLGSPLAVFLALRWKDSSGPGKFNSILPARLCHRLYNVFHPTDPVAYRIEPLLVKEYYRIAPLMIQPYNATYHTPYSELPLELQGPDQNAGNQAEGSSTNQSATYQSTQPISPGRDRNWSLWGLNLNSLRRPRRDGSAFGMLDDGLDYRLDYILRESNLGVSYLSALTSHTAYWTNYDIAYFILTQIFPELEMGGSAAAIDPMDRPPQMQQDYIDYHEPPFPQQNPQFTLSQPYAGPSSQASQLPPMSMNPPYQPQYPQQKPQQFQPPYQQQQQQQSQFQQQMVRNPNPQQQPMQQKIGFFDRASGAMDLKQQPQQNVSSPTKGTKSFFPSFNLSSLTSPVKNLSNSLSNISNQMTNMTSQGNQPQHLQQHQQHLQQQPHPQQQQQQRTGFLSGLNQQKPFNSQPQQQYAQQQLMQQQQIPHNYDQNYGPMQQQQQQQYQPVPQQQQQQMNYPQDQHNFGPQQMPLMRSASPYNHQPRSASPQAMQRAGMLQFGPLETPTGAVKQKITRIQPKVPTGFGSDMGMNTIPGAGRGRCVSPLGQSKVICSRSALPTGSLPTSLSTLPGYGSLGGRSLSSGNLRHSSVVSGAYPSYSSRTSILPASSPTASLTSSLTSSLNRRTMSRPNLSSSLGMSSLVYNSGFSSKSFLNRDYSGPSSR